MKIKLCLHNSLFAFVISVEGAILSTSIYSISRAFHREGFKNQKSDTLGNVVRGTSKQQEPTKSSGKTLLNNVSIQLFRFLVLDDG